MEAVMKVLVKIIVGISSAIACTLLVGAQQDPLEGRWEGTVQSIQGEAKATMIFKKGTDGYTGQVSRLRGDEGDIPLTQVKVNGSQITAVATVDSPNGAIEIKYQLNLQGDSLKGKGQVDFGGQTFELAYDLKRGSSGARGGTDQPGQSGPQQRPSVPQPQQKQSTQYFAGRWTFNWLARESLLGPAGPIDGSITYTMSPDHRTLDCQIQGKAETGNISSSARITFDETATTLNYDEHLANGIEIKSVGDWSSPISIRFKVEPIKTGGHTLNLRRTISIISAFSYKVTEELSTDGGPYERLGQGLFTKAMDPGLQK
jgi:hypothetical protein